MKSKEQQWEIGKDTKKHHSELCNVETKTLQSWYGMYNRVYGKDLRSRGGRFFFRGIVDALEHVFIRSVIANTDDKFWWLSIGYQLSKNFINCPPFTDSLNYQLP
ncbi:hypothetical protein BHE74_00010897 [Ensete ventricosum]|nr:hypothetical protein GW17_00009354 [Ensete ventricosum]RWW80748.1 hypothetical protein BHE74_00010897 [Ensete ventricosum]RZS14812.1 hypothetical protein BHM03_00046553 [Ensete ventricosum]